MTMAIDTHLSSAVGGVMEEIFTGEAARICRVDRRTFNNWIMANKIKPVRTIPPGFRVFDKAAIIKFAKRLPKERKKGLRYI